MRIGPIMDRKQVYQPTRRSAISDHDAFSGQTYGTIDFDVTGNRIHLLPPTDLSGGFDSFGVLISGGAGGRIMGNTMSGTGTSVALHPWSRVPC